MLAINTSPATWKKSLTMLIHQKGDLNIMLKNRPIGLVQTIRELWTIMFARLVTD